MHAYISGSNFGVLRPSFKLRTAEAAALLPDSSSKRSSVDLPNAYMHSNSSNGSSMSASGRCSLCIQARDAATR